MSNIADMVYSISLLATKLSLLLLILRVFCTVRRDLFYWLTVLLITLNSLFYALFFFIPIFQCLPRRKIWEEETPGHCLDVMGLYFTSAIFNTISDIAMLSVPLYLVWNLQMSLRRKIGISFIFCTGGLFVNISVSKPFQRKKADSKQGMYCKHLPPSHHRQALEDSGLHLRQSRMCNVGVSAPSPIHYPHTITKAQKKSC